MPISQIDPYYRTGTATFAASTAVVGQGTNWLANVQPGDQIFNRIGHMAVVESVNSDTSITLVAAFAGTVQTAQSYTIYRVPDSVRVEMFNQRMVNLLLGGNLPAFGELVLAANKLPYANGAGSLALANFTALARDLLAASTESSMRGVLEVAKKQSDKYDFASGLGLIMGAFGMGGELPWTTTAGVGTNFDTITMGGMFATTGAFTNGPFSNGGSATHTGVLINLQRSTTGLYQIYMQLSSSRILVRGFDVGAVGTPWNEIQLSTKSGFTHKIVRGENNTTYTRSWNTAAAAGAAIGPTITVTPSAANSILLISAYMRTAIEQTGTDNDAQGVATFSYQNSGGTYVVFDGVTGGNIGSVNGVQAGEDWRAQIPIIGELSASQKNAAGNWVLRPWFDPGDDATSGFAGSFSLQGCSWVLTEIVP